MSHDYWVTELHFKLTCEKGKCMHKGECVCVCARARPFLERFIFIIFSKGIATPEAEELFLLGNPTVTFLASSEMFWGVLRASLPWSFPLKIMKWTESGRYPSCMPLYDCSTVVSLQVRAYSSSTTLWTTQAQTVRSHHLCITGTKHTAWCAGRAWHYVGWMEGWAYGRVEGCLDEWMDGWMVQGLFTVNAQSSFIAWSLWYIKKRSDTKIGWQHLFCVCSIFQVLTILTCALD